MALKCWIIYATEDLVVARTIAEVVLSHGFEVVMGPEDIPIGSDNWLRWAKQTASGTDFAVLIVSENSEKSDGVKAELTHLQSLDPSPLIFPVSITKKLDHYPHHYCDKIQTKPLWNKKKPYHWLRTNFVNAITRRLTLEGIYSKKTFHAWRSVSSSLGTRPSLRKALDIEGLFNALAVDTVASLQFWPKEGLPLKHVQLSKTKEMGGKYKLADSIEKILSKCDDVIYEGPNKFLLYDYFGGHSDDPILRLSGFSVEADLVPNVHRYYGKIANALSPDLILFNPLSKSQIPNFLVLHVISTTADEQELLLIARRRKEVHYYKGYYTISWEEQVNVDEDGWDLGTALERGLKQEILGKDGFTDSDAPPQSIFSI
jgi:hypothetical protein